MNVPGQRLGRLPGGSPRHIALSVLVLTALSIATAGLALAQPTIEYGARPADDPAADRSETVFTHALEPGSSIDDAVLISNLSSEAAQYDVYGADMVPSSTGSLTPAPRSVDVVGPGTWISVGEPTVTIPPHTSVAVGLEIISPVGTPPGEYAAAVIVEPVEAAVSGAITSRTRIGLPVVVTVLGEVNLGVEVGHIETHRTGAGLEIGLRITNTGDVSFSTSGLATAEGWFGGTDQISTLEAVASFVAPGEEAYLRGLWTDPPFVGRYRIDATVEAVVGSRQPRVFDAESVTVWFIPWAWILILLALLGAGFWVFHATKDRRQQRSLRRQRERELIRKDRERHAVP